MTAGAPRIVEMRSHTFLGLGPHGFHRLAYKEWGEPSGRKLVVCVHGLTRNSRDFDFLAQALAPHCRVICPDVVGRGDSQWLEDSADYGFDLYQSDATALLARVTSPNAQTGLLGYVKRAQRGDDGFSVDWVGTSMGGVIGMMLAGQVNSPIRRLVLNDVGPLVPWAALRRLKGYVGKTSEYVDLKEVENHLREVCAQFGSLSDAQWRHLALHGARRSENGTYRLAYDPSITNPTRTGREFSFFTGRDALIGIDLWETWDAITCPTLVLRGGDSDLLLRETADEMRQRGPRAKVVELAGIGHAPALMSDNQIRIICDFLRSGE